MWILEFLFFFVTVVIVWTLFGYFIYIWFRGLFRRKVLPIIPEKLPKMTVIVACYNEEHHIAEKIKEIKERDYPLEKLEVIFVDGGSHDRTLEILEKETAGNPLFKVLHCPQKGKINQLNYALGTASGDIIVNTDADALMSRHALKWIAAEFAVSDNIWVVGAYCRPSKTLEIELYYWSTQNKCRFLESDAWASSIVMAPCYAFRKELLKEFPQDVVADDIYVAFLANTLGYRTVYSRHAMVLETRNPERLSDFIPHKFRKSNAFLRESLRFIYRLPEMNSFCKLMLFTRMVQQLFLPLALLAWITLAGSLVTLLRYDIVIICIVFIIASFSMTILMFSRIKLPDVVHHYSLITLVKGYLLTNLIMLATGLSYPFYKQCSSYARLTKKTADEGESQWA